jgi:hypothetical protein
MKILVQSIRALASDALMTGVSRAQRNIRPKAHLCAFGRNDVLQTRDRKVHRLL